MRKVWDEIYARGFGQILTSIPLAFATVGRVLSEIFLKILKIAPIMLVIEAVVRLLWPLFLGIRAVLGKILDTVNWILDTFAEMGAYAREVLFADIDRIHKLIGDIFTGLLEWLNKGWTWWSTYFSDAMKAATDLFLNPWQESIKKWPGYVWTALLAIATAFWNIFTGIRDFVGDIVRGIKDVIKTVLIDPFREGMAAVFTWIANKLNAISSRINSLIAKANAIPLVNIPTIPTIPTGTNLPPPSGMLPGDKGKLEIELNIGDKTLGSVTADAIGRRGKYMANFRGGAIN